jgi:hypothetical protein
MILVDTDELRTAVDALRAAADGSDQVTQTLPREVYGAPGWLAGWANDALWAARNEVASLVDELRVEATELDNRATEVDEAEQRWWQLDASGMSCGCTLPSGEVVTYAGQTSAPASNVVNGVTYVTTDGQPIDMSNVPLWTTSTIGGDGAGIGVYPTVTVNPGSDSSIIPQYTMTYGGGPGLDTPLDAQIQAGADKMAAGILGLVGAGGSGPVPTTGGQTIIGAMNQGPTTIVGDGKHIYTLPFGTPVVDDPSRWPGTTPVDALATGGVPG